MDFWRNFTYCIKIEFYYPKEDKTEMAYVTAVNYSPKTFEYRTLKQIQEQGLSIETFKLEQAVDLMNSIFCNGYKASIEPYFKEEV